MLCQSANPETGILPDFTGICAAVATPPGQSGLAVIRLSGPGSADLVALMFRPAGSRFPPVAEMPGYTCAVGDLVDPASQAPVDQVVLTCFRAPHSYTGEEVIELSCHGGTVVKQTILDIIFRLGAKPAEPGEFTRRAFLNGKMDLAQAEAVMDLIQAGAERSARAAAAQLHGRLSEQVRLFADRLYRILAQIEMILEYPEHDDAATAQADLTRRLAETGGQLQAWTGSYNRGRLLREGLTVVIAGRPNAGKSSLLNALAGHDRAIVTPIPGTTRDTIEERVDIAGLPVRLIDTAGLRETADPVEHLGVDRAWDALRQADLVFWLIAPPQDNLAAELAAIGAADCRNILPVIAKDDLDDDGAMLEQMRRLLPDQPLLTCSSLTGEGLAQIRQAIVTHYEQAGTPADDERLVTNSRHHACLSRAAGLVEQAFDGLSAGLPLDIAASLIRGSLDALAELTGDAVTEELVKTLFSRFCVGK